MSFSGKLKGELAEQKSRARHCKLAELQGLFQFGKGSILPMEEKFFFVV